MHQIIKIRCSQLNLKKVFDLLVITNIFGIKLALKPWQKLEIKKRRKNEKEIPEHQKNITSDIEEIKLQIKF